jgi:hypothetical protein
MNVSRGRGSAVAPFRTARRAAALVALAGALCISCSNVCDEAADHVEECGFTDGDRYGGASCDGNLECSSECYIKAPCGAFDGTDAAARDAWLECINGC